MADKKISALPAASTPLAGTEVLPIVQGGTTDQVSVANLTAGRNVSVAGLTTTGNIALATTISPWSGVEAFEMDAIALLNGSANYSQIVHNAYVGSGGWTYKNTGFAYRIQMGQDGIEFFSAPSGTAGTAISWVAAATVTSAANIAPAAGKGIDFSAATHAAGMTSELLNDYEEGTWTATISDGTTDATMNAGRRVGTYTRVGRQVTVTNYIATTSMTGVTGNLRIKGLPFTVGNSPTVGGAIGYCDSSMVFTLGQSMVLQTASGVDYIVIRYWNGAAGTPNMTGAQWGAVGEIGFTLTYFV